MMQGDAYTLMIEILKADGEPVTPADVLDVEVTIGMHSKTYTDGDLKYADGMWNFPLTQEETFRYQNTYQDAQVRVRWTSGDVEGVSLGQIYVDRSSSRRVL